MIDSIEVTDEITTAFDGFDAIDPPEDSEAVIPAAPPPESPSWKMLEMRLVLPRSGPELTVRLSMQAEAAAPILQEAERLEAELRQHVGEQVGASEESVTYQNAVSREYQLQAERARLSASLNDLENQAYDASMERLTEIAGLEAETKATSAVIDKALASSQRQRTEAEKALRRVAVSVADSQRTRMMNFVEQTEAVAGGLLAEAAGELSELIKVGILRGAITGALWGEMTAQRAVEELMVKTVQPPRPSAPQGWQVPFGPMGDVGAQYGLPALKLPEGM